MGAKNSVGVVEIVPAGSPNRLGQLRKYLKSDINGVVARWQERSQNTQLCAVVRHAERADAIWAYWKGVRWTQTEDFLRWQLDPPLSDVGLEAAGAIGEQILAAAIANNTTIHVVVTSPYFRCVQTAAEICAKLGSSVRVLVDHSLGEVYGPSVMGETKPVATTRPRDQLRTWCRSRGVRMMNKSIGDSPEWPEDFRSARRRYAERFLTFLHRGFKAKRNFILVSHADCVGASLTVMPSQANKMVESVEFGGLFLATCRHDEYAATAKPPAGSARAVARAVALDMPDTCAGTLPDIYTSAVPTPPTVPMPEGARSSTRPPSLTLASLATLAALKKKAPLARKESGVVPAPPAEPAPESPRRRAPQRILSRSGNRTSEDTDGESLSPGLHQCPGSPGISPGLTSSWSTKLQLLEPRPPDSPRRPPARGSSPTRSLPPGPCADPELAEEPGSAGRRLNRPEFIFEEEDEEDEQGEPVWMSETEKVLDWMENVGPELPQSVVPVKQGDGWVLDVHNVKVSDKPGKKNSSLAFRKRVQQLGRTSKYSVSQIERLLLNMADRSLGVGDGIDEVEMAVLIEGNPSLASGHANQTATHTSLSTYLFGMSEAGASDVYSEDSFGRHQTSTSENREDSPDSCGKVVSVDRPKWRHHTSVGASLRRNCGDESQEALDRGPRRCRSAIGRIKSTPAGEALRPPLSPLRHHSAAASAAGAARSLSIPGQLGDEPAEDTHPQEASRATTSTLPERRRRGCSRHVTATSGEDEEYTPMSLKGFCNIMRNEVSSCDENDSAKVAALKVVRGMSCLITDEARFDRRIEPERWISADSAGKVEIIDGRSEFSRKCSPTYGDVLPFRSTDSAAGTAPHSPAMPLVWNVSRKSARQKSDLNAPSASSSRDISKPRLPTMPDLSKLQSRQGKAHVAEQGKAHVSEDPERRSSKNTVSTTDTSDRNSASSSSKASTPVALKSPGESLLMRRRSNSGLSASIPPLTVGQPPKSAIVRFSLNIGVQGRPSVEKC